MTTEQLKEKVLSDAHGDIKSAMQALCDGAYLQSIGCDSEDTDDAYNDLKEML